MAKKKKARKKTAAKRASKKRTAREGSAGGSLFKIFATLAILVVFVIAAAITAHLIISPHRGAGVKKPAAKSVPVPGKKTEEKAPTVSPPTYEIYPAQDSPGDRAILPTKKRPRPAVAIIIDDMGYKKRLAEKFCRLDTALTFSVFPHSPYKTPIIKSATENGIEIMVHLPMEPNEYPRIDPGPGALLAAMSPDELIAELNRNLDDVPLAKGVNNHMGSRLTGSSFQMNQLFSILKKRDLFFIDSRTTSKTVARQSARLLQVPFSQRDIFLDHVQEEAFVKKQLAALVKTARQHGEAVGIGHPYEITLEVLEEMLPEIKKQVDIVPASQMVHLVPYS